jgi:hypothetical protein
VWTGGDVKIHRRRPEPARAVLLVARMKTANWLPWCYKWSDIAATGLPTERRPE